MDPKGKSFDSFKYWKDSLKSSNTIQHGYFLLNYLDHLFIYHNDGMKAAH